MPLWHRFKRGRYRPNELPNAGIVATTGAGIHTQEKGAHVMALLDAKLGRKCVSPGRHGTRIGDVAEERLPLRIGMQLTLRDEDDRPGQAI